MIIIRSQVNTKDILDYIDKQVNKRFVYPYKYLILSSVEEVFKDNLDLISFKIRATPMFIIFEDENTTFKFLKIKEKVSVNFFTNLSASVRKEYPYYGYSDISKVEDYITDKINAGSGASFSYHTISFDLEYPVDWLSKIFNGGSNGITVQINTD